MTKSIHDDIERILVSESEIQEICKKLGKAITADYKTKEPIILLGLLKGCVPFMGDIIKHLNIPLEMEFMDVESYKGGVSSTGDIKIRIDINTTIKGRNILICEDIIDTGKTLDTVIKLLLHRGAKNVEVVTLLDKPAARVIPLKPKYIGITIPKEFVVGYGMDYKEYYRNLPYVGILKNNVIDKE